MSFLRINGCPLIMRDGVKIAHAQHGEVDPSFRGRPNRERRGSPRSFQGIACFYDVTNADSIEGLIGGRGHQWSFDDAVEIASDLALGPGGAYSGAGLGPDSAGAGVTYTLLESDRGGPRARFGTGMLFLDAAVTFNAELREDKHTVMLWQSNGSPLTRRDWTHWVLRSDGAQWVDGVRDDAEDMSDIVVSDGGVALGGVDFDHVDDMVILPYELSDDCIEAFHRWSTQAGLVFHVPFDDDGLDVEGGVLGAPNGAPAFALGQVDGAASFDGAADFFDYLGLAGALAVFSSGALGFSVSSWVDPDTLPGDIIGNASVVAAGWEFLVTATGAIRMEIVHATTPAVAETAAGVVTTAEGFSHIAASYDPATLKITIRKNSAVQTLATDTAGVGALSDDSGEDMFVGKSGSIGSDLWDGLLDEVKVRWGVPTQAEWEEEFVCGLRGLRANKPQQWSSLPLLRMDGDVVGGPGCGIVDVVGKTEEQTHKQRGGTSVGATFQNHIRELPLTLDERRYRERHNLPRASQLFLLDDKYRDTGGDVHAAHGGYEGAVALNTVSPTYGEAGPYEIHGRSARFNGTTQRLDLDDDARRWLGGATGLTLAAWVTLANSAPDRSIIELADTGSTVCARLGISAGGELVFGARATTADAFAENSTGTVLGADDGRWHLIAGTYHILSPIDFAGGRMRQYLDGVFLESSTPTVPTVSVFTDEAGTSQSIGSDAAGAGRF